MARVISAVIFIPILLAVIWLAPPIVFTALIGLATILGLLEFRNLAKHLSLNTSAIPMLAAGLALLAAFHCLKFDLIPPVVAALVVLSLTLQLFFNRDLSKAMQNSAAELFGVGWVALLGGYLVALRVAPEAALAPRLISLFLLIVFAGDTGAYYAGRNFGRHKLAPSISPGKTIEGLIGGLIANILAVVIAHFTFFPTLQLLTAIPLALLMGALGVIGDLCESMLKRGSGVKDAANLIPGHGGILDRLDSILFNAPVIFYYYQFFIR